MSDPALTVRPACPDDFAGIAELFKRSGSPCFCRWWHFEGDKNAWLDRCANAPEKSESELERAFAEETEHSRGVVGITASGLIVGWMKVTPASAVSKIYQQKLYRGLPCFEANNEDVWTIGCFLIDEAHRKAGLGGALIRAGLALARRAGAKAVDAFPRRAEGLAAEEKWTGSYSALRREGFVVVHDFGPYPVVRCDLSPQH